MTTVDGDPPGDDPPGDDPPGDDPPGGDRPGGVAVAAPDEATPGMGIDPFERNWMRFSAALLVVFFTTVSVAGFAMGFQVNGEDAEVDPRTVLDDDPWANPGLREIAPGEYHAYVVAQTWAFVPRELEVPVGSEVTIFVTSPDLQHGFKVTGTNINTMVLPGQVSKVTYTFDEVGEYPYICHEYCGSGHANMYGVVNVVPPAPADGSSADEPSADGSEADESGGDESSADEPTTEESMSAERGARA